MIVAGSPFGFIVGSDGVCVQALREQDRLDAMGVNPSTSAGMDLLTDDGMPWHIVRLRRSLRE